LYQLRVVSCCNKRRIIIIVSSSSPENVFSKPRVLYFDEVMDTVRQSIFG